MSDTMRKLGSGTRQLLRPRWVGILLAILWGVYSGGGQRQTVHGRWAI